MSSNGHTGKTVVYLVRHGLTDWNAEKRMQGQTDVALNETGLYQADLVSTWIAEQPVKFGVIYTSDLRRAAQTAHAIAERLHLAPIPAKALREIHCGAWEGFTGAEMDQRYPEEREKWRANRYSYRMPGGENVADVQARVSEFYWKMIKQHEGQTILVVTHGLALLSLVAALQSVHIEEFWRQKTFIGNTSVTIVAHTNGRTEIERFNSIEHLPE